MAVALPVPRATTLLQERNSYHKKGRGFRPIYSSREHEEANIQIIQLWGGRQDSSLSLSSSPWSGGQGWAGDYTP